MNRSVLAVLCVALPLLAGCTVTPMARAIKKRDQAALIALLNKGADPKAIVGGIGDGYTALEYAACVGNHEAITELLKRGADIESGNRAWTPLHRAVACNVPPKPATVRLLLDHGAKVNKDILALAQDGYNDGSITEMIEKAYAAANPPEERTRPGNLDDAAYDRMRAAAGIPPEKREPVSDVDQPKRRGAERPDDFALVIGIEEYQSVPKADYGARDAKTVRKHLEALGFPARNIISLEGPQATGSKLKSYLEEWLPLNVKATSTLFVYYSGHGAPDAKTGDAYLVPWDGDPKFLKSTALPMKSFFASLAKTKARRVVVALDACFSGAGGRSVLAQGARPLVAKTAELTPAAGRITVLAAASGDEITGTLQEQGHGMFTYHLLKGLSADPKASAQSLFDYLKPRVQDDARRDNREQTPVLAGASLNEPLFAP